MKKPARITIKLGAGAAQLLMMNIDGWLDAGACEDGLTPSENRALQSAYHQISQQLQRIKKGSRQ